MIGRLDWVLFAVLVVGASAARAEGSSTAQLHWTYPADGDVEVPTDSGIWVRHLNMGSSAAVVRLNDETLAPREERGWVYDAILSPLTDYTLTVSFEDDDGNEREEFHRDISFTTGVGPAAPPLTPEVTGHMVEAPSSTSDDCVWEMFADDCFDVGVREVVFFDVSPDAFLLRMDFADNNDGSGRTKPWLTKPSQCSGRAVAYLPERKVSNGDCFWVTSISPSGEETTSETYCGLERAPRESAEDAPGLVPPFGCACVTAARPVPVGVFSVLTVALLVGGRRRSRSRSLR